MDEKETTWKVLDRAKDDEFEEELKRLEKSLTERNLEEVETAVKKAIEATKKSFEDPEDEQWRIVDSSHPAPPLSLDSPVIRHILDHWTDNMERLKFMQAWLQHILNGWPVHGKDGKFRQGLELAKLSPEVCDGFEKLIIPLLRRRNDITVQAMARTQRTTWKDLRIKVTPSAEAPLFSNPGTRNGRRNLQANVSTANAARHSTGPPAAKQMFVAPRKKAPKPPQRR